MGWITEMANIHDVAAKAGVSAATVSRFINSSGYVGAKTRTKIREAMEALDYVPNSMARSLRTNESMIVALVIPDVTNPFFPTVVRGVDDVASKSDYRLMLFNTDGSKRREENILSVLAQTRVDGVIVIPSETVGDAQITDFLEQQRFPIVLVDRVIDFPQVDCIMTDHYLGAYQAAQHLCGLGHRRIAHIAGPRRVVSSEERVKGYAAALNDFGIPVDQSLVVHGDFTRYTGYGSLDSLMNLPEAPTAVFAANDLMAIGVIERARELGIKVPEDLAVCGFDDIEYASIVSPSLTTVSQETYRLGKLSAQLLLRRIAEPDCEVRRIKLKPNLIVRESAARVYQHTLGRW